MDIKQFSTVRFTTDSILKFPLVSNYLRSDKLGHEEKNILVTYTLKTLHSIPLSCYENRPNLHVIRRYLDDLKRDGTPTIFDVAETLVLANFINETYDTLHLLNQIKSEILRQSDIEHATTQLNRFTYLYISTFLKKILYSSNVAIYSKIAKELGEQKFEEICCDWFVCDEKVKDVQLIGFTSDHIMLSKFMLLLCIYNQSGGVSDQAQKLLTEHIDLIVQMLPVALGVVSLHHVSRMALLTEFKYEFNNLFNLISAELAKKENHQHSITFITLLKKLIEKDSKTFNLLYPMVADQLSYADHHKYLSLHIKSPSVSFSVKDLLIKKQESGIQQVFINYNEYIVGIAKFMTFKSDSIVMIDSIAYYFNKYYDASKDDGHSSTILRSMMSSLTSEPIDISCLTLKALPNSLLDLFLYTYENDICNEPFKKIVFKFLFVFMLMLGNDRVDEYQIPFLNKYKEQIQLFFNDSSSFAYDNIVKEALKIHLGFFNICLSLGQLTLNDKSITSIMDIINKDLCAIQDLGPVATFIECLPSPVQRWKDLITTCQYFNEMMIMMRFCTLPKVITFYIRHFYGSFFDHSYRNTAFYIAVNQTRHPYASSNESLPFIYNKLSESEKQRLIHKLDTSFITNLRREYSIENIMNHSEVAGISFYKDKVSLFQQPASDNNIRIELPQLSHIIWKQVMLYLLEDETLSTTWKVRTIPLVCKLFFQLAQSILSYHPIKSLRINAMLSNIGREYCLFKNTPRHLVDFEIALIPPKKHQECIDNLLSLTQTFGADILTDENLIDDESNEIVHGKTLIHYLDNCPKLTTIHFQNYKISEEIQNLYYKNPRDNTNLDHLVSRCNQFKLFSPRILDDNANYDIFTYYDEFSDYTDDEDDGTYKEHILETFISNYINLQAEKNVRSVTFASQSISTYYLHQCLHLLNQLKLQSGIDINVDLTIKKSHSCSSIKENLWSLVRSLRIMVTQIGIINSHFVNLTSLHIFRILEQNTRTTTMQRVYHDCKSLRQVTLESETNVDLLEFIPNSDVTHFIERFEILLRDTPIKINDLQIDSKKSIQYFSSILSKLDNPANKSIVYLVISAKSPGSGKHPIINDKWSNNLSSFKKINSTTFYR